MKLIWQSTIAIILTASGFTAPASADVVIDDFSSAVNTIEIEDFFGVPPFVEFAKDTDLPGVVGGTRLLTVESFETSVKAGVAAGGLLMYSSVGRGSARLDYPGPDAGGLGGSQGLQGALSCAESIEVDYLNANDAARGVGTGNIQIVLGLLGPPLYQLGPLPIESGAGTLSFPLSDIPNADDFVKDVFTAIVIIDGSNSDSASLAISEVRAVCPIPAVPSPALAPGLLYGTVALLAALGALAIKRRA